MDADSASFNVIVAESASRKSYFAGLLLREETAAINIDIRTGKVR